MTFLCSEQQSKQNQKVSVKFAGATYTVDQRVTATDLKKFATQDKKKLGGQASELDSLVNMIDNKDKNINALTKTKIDWDKHTKEQKLEDELEKNRKDGYLAKQQFLNQA